MDALLLASIFVLITAVALVVGRPFYRPEPVEDRNDRLAELELRKQAKYSEIRDAEADFKGGKLSEDDYRLVDAELKAEAIEILREMDKVGPAGAVDGSSAASR